MEEKKTNELRKERIKVYNDDIEIIVEDPALHCGSPCYKIKYKEVGKNHYNVGFGSFCLENVIKWRKEKFEVVGGETENKEEMKETKEINEESKLDVLKRKIDVLLESQATIMNAIGSVICMSEIKDEDLKMKNATLENLINHMDTCMKEVHGEFYEELFKTMDKVVNNLGDILDKIFK